MKKADASRIYGLELEHLLSPNRLNFLTHGGTLIEEHVAEEPHEAALVELHELLGDPDRAQLRAVEPALDEDVPGYPRDVLLDERRPVSEEIEAVRGEQVLKLKAVDPRRVGLLHVEVVLVVVVRVDDPDPEGRRVPERAEIDAVRVEVLDDRHVAVDLEHRVHLLERLVQRAHLLPLVDHRVPQGRLAVGVCERNHLAEAPEPLVGDRKVPLPLVGAQVPAQALADGIGRLLACRRRRIVPGRVVGHSAPQFRDGALSRYASQFAASSWVTRLPTPYAASSEGT